MSTLIALIIITGATIRITRLITTDKISEPLRQWVTHHNGEKGWFTFLIHCPWCTGYWIALPATITAWYLTNLPTYVDLTPWAAIPALWSTLAYTTGYTLTQLEK